MFFMLRDVRVRETLPQTKFMSSINKPREMNYEKVAKRCQFRGIQVQAGNGFWVSLPHGSKILICMYYDAFINMLVIELEML